MGQEAVTWKLVKAYFERRGYEIKSAKGGDKKIIAPKDGNPTGKRTRNQVVIGHKFCTKMTAQVTDAYLNAIKRAFGVTRKDILEG